MKNSTVKLNALTFAAALLPALALYSCGPGSNYCLGAAVIAAALVSYPVARILRNGLLLPFSNISGRLKAFILADGRLETPLPKEGWSEAQGVVSGLNRLMLELGAYRAFHLNQVVEDRAKAQALIETITDGVLLVGERGRLIYSNQRALRLLGIPAQEQDITLPASVGEQAFAAAVAEALAGTDAALKAEVSVPPAPDGSPPGKEYRVISRRFDLATFKRPGRVIVIRDVTMEKEIESARETFFHMVTHDMRAPLSSIQGYAQLLEKDMPPGSGGKKHLQVIRRASARLNGMISDILNTVKLERGEMTLVPVRLEARDMCARVYELHAPLAARKGITLSMDLPAEDLFFSGDPRLLERVLCNLVGNSLKFAAAGGKVVISCRGAEGETLFGVQDDGPGIPREKQQEIFEKYAQLEEHKYMGFGLGLAMCRMAVELHKGRIWVESEEGRGSRFCFVLPCVPQAPPR